jgi:aspartate/tyrosine/aromatic aminotransferase
MFEGIEPAPADPILGLTEAFNADPCPDKINLGVGIFKDAQGKTPVLDVVKEAEKRLLSDEKTKAYLPIDGNPAYGRAVQALLFGATHPIVEAKRVATSHTPGGTGALRVVADFLHARAPKARVWVSQPTWENHTAIFAAAGMETQAYRYFDAASSRLDFDGMLADLETLAPGDVALLHACCHNPTGVDPSIKQWSKIAGALAERRAIPLLDFAYQGFGGQMEEDAAGLRALLEHHDELFVCSSFSKNFGLYRERVGALSVVAKDAQQAAAAQSHVKIAVRRNYSNPASHGGEVVRLILEDTELHARWLSEVSAMRERLAGIRRAFAQALDDRGVQLSPRGNRFIVEQKGMFSFSGLSAAQVDRLRSELSIYVVRSGRINVAGITEGNLPRLADAIAKVA